MKTLTCRDLGGSCSQSLTADSWGEMGVMMLHHAIEIHPDLAQRIELMHRDSPGEWSRTFQPVWDHAPEQYPTDTQTY